MNVPFAKVALPAPPTAPTSLSSQPEAKPLAANTVSETVVEFLKLPYVPVTVTVAGPVAATLLARRVNVLEPLAGLGLNNAVTPLGRPERERLTLPVKPFCGARVIAVMPLPPCGMLKPLGDAESVKFGPGFTVTETVAV